MEETPERPAWAPNETEIVLVKIALGGDYAQSAFFDLLSGGVADLDTVRRTSAQINKARSKPVYRLRRTRNYRNGPG